MIARRYFLHMSVTCFALTAVQTAAYFALAKTLPTVTAFPEITAALDSLDDHLAFRTFLVGHDLTAADWAVWGALKGPSAYALPLRQLHSSDRRKRQNCWIVKEQQACSPRALVLSP